MGINLRATWSKPPPWPLSKILVPPWRVVECSFNLNAYTTYMKNCTSYLDCLPRKFRNLISLSYIALFLFPNFVWLFISYFSCMKKKIACIYVYVWLIWMRLGLTVSRCLCFRISFLLCFISHVWIKFAERLEGKHNCLNAMWYVLC